MGISSVNHGDNANRRIDEELVSVDSLKHVLCTHCGCKEVFLNREQHDPPDFTVTIDGEIFPTEVTSIVWHQQSLAQYEEFVKAIRDCADSLGILSGTYAFKVSRLPCIPKPTSKNGHQLLDVAVQYIDNTQQQGVSPGVQLAQDRSGKISIEKVSASGSSVRILWSSPAMWEGDIQNQLATLIQRSVDDKKRKLQGTGISFQRALLLLYDAFGYAEPEDVVAAMQQVNGYEWFHSIFWVASFLDRKNTTYPEEPGRDGFFLFSINTSWNRVSPVS
ncbi:MAG: hypothetical protein PHS96_11110 [Anaerolineales bacterium]|nr:hypothetical protein [Anaerolineales bacterium]